MALAAGTRQLQDRLLGWRTGLVCDVDFERCLAGRLHPDMPEGKSAGRQKEWDTLSVQEEYSQLLARYTEPRRRARLLAASSNHSGDWLHALPIAACSLHLDNEAIRVVVGLRLGCFASHMLAGAASPLTLLTRTLSLASEAPAEYYVTTTSMTLSGAR